MTDLISLLWMELYQCRLVKQHKCKRGVNCFHISFRQQMRREMHFTGTRTGGVCLARCNVEHLFLFPRDAGLFRNMATVRVKEEEGGGVSAGGGRRALLSSVLMVPSFLCLTTSCLHIC